MMIRRDGPAVTLVVLLFLLARTALGFSIQNNARFGAWAPMAQHSATFTTTKLFGTRITGPPEELVAGEDSTTIPVVSSGTQQLEEVASSPYFADPHIDFTVPKKKHRLSLHRLAQQLDEEVYEREWFVTGAVNPTYFHPDFTYQDADVTLPSLKAYARNVYQLFDQSCSRAEVVETKVNKEQADTITCVWRCSGKAKIFYLAESGWGGLPIKPFLVTTHWHVDRPTGLIDHQVDEYALPQWDLLLSAVCPFLNGIVTAEPAPPVAPRKLRTAKAVPLSPFAAWATAAGGLQTYFELPKKIVEVVTSNNKNYSLEDLVESLAEEMHHHLFAPAATADTSGTRPVEGGKGGSHTSSSKSHAYSRKSSGHTPLPTIRPPTLWDRLQAYAPADHPALLERLSEATRRTEDRRARRYYVTYNSEEDDEKGDDISDETATAQEEAKRMQLTP